MVIRIADIKSVAKLVTPIAQKYAADRVALFGSRAKNKATETSDYDFVISKGDIQSLFQLASFIDELKKAFGANIDVITDTSNNIEFLERNEIVWNSSVSDILEHCQGIEEMMWILSAPVLFLALITASNYFCGLQSVNPLICRLHILP